MMIFDTPRITTPDGGGLRAFTVGTGSFGALQSVRAHATA
jgi:hypothetical protein